LAQGEPGLTLVTLGPLTNIALALKRDPKLAERIGRCVVMGGAPCCEGNVTPAAEYNIWVDPEAARAVFRSKLNIEMIGWHVSRGPSVLKEDEIAAIEALGTAKAKFAIESNMTAREAYRVQTGETGLSLADPTAMAVALDRSIGLAWSRHRVAIETGSRLTRGMTVVDRLNVHHDSNNAHVWREAAGEHEGADILWTLDARRFKAMLKAALAA
jgi:purine nucleosidase